MVYPSTAFTPLRLTSLRIISNPPFYPSDFYPASFYSVAYLARFASQGKVELQASPKDASVYINGAYAGRVEHLKSFPLVSGAYDLEVKASGYRTFHQRIYILTDRTLHIAAHLRPLSPQSGEKP